jgi:hypothetical protein
MYVLPNPVVWKGLGLGDMPRLPQMVRLTCLPLLNPGPPLYAWDGVLALLVLRWGVVIDTN